MLLLSLQVFQMTGEGFCWFSCEVMSTYNPMTPLSMNFSSKDAGVGCHFFLLRDQTPGLLRCELDSLITEPPGKGLV